MILYNALFGGFIITFTFKNLYKEIPNLKHCKIKFLVC